MSLSLEATFADVGAAQAMYKSQLSKQRLFVPFSGAAAEGTKVDLRLVMEEPATRVDLSALVFRQIDAVTARKHKLGEVAGVVLNVPITDAVKGPLRAFLTGRGQAVSAVDPAALEGVANEAQAFLKRTEGKSHYEVLGLTPRARKGEVRKAYMKRMRKFHPDTYYRQLDEAALELLEQAFQRVTSAFEVLADSRSRDRYDLEIGTARSTLDPLKRKRLELLKYREENKEQIEKAKKLFKAALEDEKEGRMGAARNKLKLAKSFDPRNPLIDRKLAELS